MRGSHAALLAVAVALGSACGGGASAPDAAVRDAGLCTTDEQCDDGLFCNGAEACVPASRAAGPRGCVPAPDPCTEAQVCREAEARCLTDCELTGDADGDGHHSVDCGGDDCDDADPRRFPGNAEVCDPASRDEDCDPTTLGHLDQDGDGFDSSACCNRQPDGSLACAPDCDDTTIAQRPDQLEICDDVDNDCDGAVDEEMNEVPWYPDTDGDGFGASGGSMVSCSPLPDRSLLDTDCDDTVAAASPAGTEACDGVDNDCDGTVDEGMRKVPWYRDADADGYGVTGDAVESCAALAGRSLVGGDCDDTTVEVNPIAAERCNRIDDDCDSTIDEGVCRGGGL